MIEVNLLPQEYRRRRSFLQFDKKLIYVGVGSAALLVILGFLTLYQGYQLGELDDRIANARIEVNRYQKDIAIIDALTEVKEKILQRLEAVERLDRKRDYYVRLMKEVNRRIPEFLWMSGFHESPPTIAVEPAQKPGMKPGSGANSVAAQPIINPDIGRATIDGYAFNFNSIGSFMIGLMKSDYFDNITLGRAVQEKVSDVEAYSFQIVCDLRYDAVDLIDEFEDMPADQFNLSVVADEEM